MSHRAAYLQGCQLILLARISWNMSMQERARLFLDRAGDLSKYAIRARCQMRTCTYGLPYSFDEPFKVLGGLIGSYIAVAVAVALLLLLLLRIPVVSLHLATTVQLEIQIL